MKGYDTIRFYMKGYTFLALFIALGVLVSADVYMVRFTLC